MPFHSVGAPIKIRMNKSTIRGLTKVSALERPQTREIELFDLMRFLGIDTLF